MPPCRRPACRWTGTWCRTATTPIAPACWRRRNCSSRRQLPTAVFGSNDDMAAAVVSVAHRRGLDVPRDLSVVGFDDSSSATTVWPELTTIRQPIGTHGRRSGGHPVAAHPQWRAQCRPGVRPRTGATAIRRPAGRQKLEPAHAAFAWSTPRHGADTDCSSRSWDCPWTTSPPSRYPPTWSNRRDGSATIAPLKKSSRVAACA